MSEGFITAVWSPKGGVGKTMLAAAVALHMAQKQRTVLVDGNPDNPDVATLLQAPASPNVSSWPGQVRPEDVEAHLVRRSSRLFLLPGPTRYVDEGVLSKELMEDLLRSLKTAGLSVVVDLSCSLRDSTLIALDLADSILMPVTLDLLAVFPLIRLVKEQDLIQLPLRKFQVVVNRHTDTREITVEDIRQHSGCPVVGVIPSSKVAAGAINTGNSDMALGPASPIGKAVAGFISQVASARA